MNAVEAMQALVDGKKVRQSVWDDDVYATMVDEGLIVYERDGVRTGQAHYMRWHGEFELYQEPNPHAKGSFPWALEETKRGRKVRRATYQTVLSSPGVLMTYGFSEPAVLATDWEVVK